jgi:hypothetical protein
VGDFGPHDKLGEASVAMNRTLNGLAEGDNPKNGADADKRFRGPRSLVLVFPGKVHAENLLDYPVTRDRVVSIAKARFDAWGGLKRLDQCAAAIPEMNTPASATPAP